MFCCDCMRAGLKKKQGVQRGAASSSSPFPSLRNCVLALHNPRSLSPAFATTACVPGLKKKRGVQGGAAPRRGGGGLGGGRSPPPILLRLKVAVFHFLPQTISCGFFFCVLFADEIESCLILFVPLFSVQSAYVCLLSFLSVGMKFHL